MDIVQNSHERNIFENYVNESTTDMSLAEIIKDESQQVTTVVIFVISAVLVIILIFVSAVFIDCRQQKIQENSKVKRLRKRAKRKIQKVLPALPTIGEMSPKDDERTIVENMEAPSTSSPAYIV